MNNVKPEEHFKNFFKYETFKTTFLADNYDKLNFEFKPKLAAKKLVGFYPELRAGSGSVLNSNCPVARLSLLVNNRQSLPLVTLVYERSPFYDYKRQTKFIELNETLTQGSFISGFSHAIKHNISSQYSIYLICKYST